MSARRVRQLEEALVEAIAFVTSSAVLAGKEVPSSVERWKAALNGTKEKR